MKGYKGFNKDLTCRGFQYEIGKEYEHKGEIELCKSGFHFCKNILDVPRYYDIKDEEVRLCEIEATGEIKEDEVENKCVTNKIKIIREISKEEMYKIANIGSENKGLGNTGDRNTGDLNMGCSNTGDLNIGCLNTGDLNIGDSNTGDWNTGDWNIGNRNTGEWNKTDRSAGVFCNKESKMMMFNKETDMTWGEWRDSKACYILKKNVKSMWINYGEMTEEEKEKYPNAETCGGYLKEIERKESSKKLWNNLDNYEKATIFKLPNFDLEIFNDIMGLEITKKEYEEILNSSSLLGGNVNENI